MLPLESGYIQRAAGLLPKQGTRFPWQVHQSYLADYRAMKRKPVDDGTMRFTNPRPRRAERAEERPLATAAD